MPLGYRSVQYKLWEDGPLRDLSAWRVTIPEILVKQDPENPKRNIHPFRIEVRRVDVLESRWFTSILVSLGFYWVFGMYKVLMSPGGVDDIGISCIDNTQFNS